MRHPPRISTAGPKHLRVEELDAVRDGRSNAPERRMIAVASHLDVFSVELHASVGIECDLADPKAQIDAVDRCNTTSNVGNLNGSFVSMIHCAVGKRLGKLTVHLGFPWHAHPVMPRCQRGPAAAQCREMAAPPTTAPAHL